MFATGRREVNEISTQRRKGTKAPKSPDLDPAFLPLRAFAPSRWIPGLLYADARRSRSRTAAQAPPSGTAAITISSHAASSSRCSAA